MDVFAPDFFEGGGFEGGGQHGVCAIAQYDLVDAEDNVRQFVMVAGKACVVVAVAVLSPKGADAGVDFGIGAQAILEIEVGIEDVAVFASAAQAPGDFDGGVLRGEEVSRCALAVNIGTAVVVSQGRADFEAVLGGGDAFQAERQVGVSVCGEKKEGEDKSVFEFHVMLQMRLVAS